MFHIAPLPPTWILGANFEIFEFLTNCKFLKLGNSCISNYSNEPEGYNTAKTYFSEDKFSVLSIFEDKFSIGHHLDFFSGPFSQKIAKKVNLQKRHNLKQSQIASKFDKIEKFFSQIFNMAAIFKMAENWFIDHNSVSFEHFCVLSFDLSLYFSRTYIIEEKFFVRFKMAFDVQVGGRNSK
jgi:hypothetical protein